MVIDTSVLLAILLQEPEAARLSRAIVTVTTRLMSVASALEAGIVIQNRLGDEGARDLDLLLLSLRLTLVPVTERQLTIARRAYRTYGKGQHHPAGLNYGDLFAYALAKDTGEPLLFKGEDFTQTDIVSARY
ncbi:MAG TPA: type II toxin-antitoxin system VapC family toxin [Thermomicrobiales bacterium]|jgi:ribonuclease VapC